MCTEPWTSLLLLTGSRRKQVLGQVVKLITWSSHLVCLCVCGRTLEVVPHFIPFLCSDRLRPNCVESLTNSCCFCRSSESALTTTFTFKLHEHNIQNKSLVILVVRGSFHVYWVSLCYSYRKSQHCIKNNKPNKKCKLCWLLNIPFVVDHPLLIDWDNIVFEQHEQHMTWWGESQPGVTTCYTHNNKQSKPWTSQGLVYERIWFVTTYWAAYYVTRCKQI